MPTFGGTGGSGGGGNFAGGSSFTPSTNDQLNMLLWFIGATGNPNSEPPGGWTPALKEAAIYRDKVATKGKNIIRSGIDYVAGKGAGKINPLWTAIENGYGMYTDTDAFIRGQQFVEGQAGGAPPVLIYGDMLLGAQASQAMNTGGVTLSPAGSSEIGDDVWSQLQNFQDAYGVVTQYSAYYALTYLLKAFLWQASLIGFPLPGNPSVRIVTGSLDVAVFAGNPWALSDPETAIDPIDWTARAASQTATVYLNTLGLGVTWQEIPPWSSVGHPAVSYAPTAGGYWWLKATIPGQGEQMFGQPTAPGAGDTSYRYPNGGGLIPGEPVPISSMGHIDGPMIGCIVNITAPGPQISAYNMVGTDRYYRAGYVAFHDAAGVYEPLMYIDYPTGLFIVQHLEQAAGVDVWTKPNTSATVTPIVRAT